MDPGNLARDSMPLNTIKNGYHLLRPYPGAGAILKTYSNSFQIHNHLLSSQTAYFFRIHTSRKAILIFNEKRSLTSYTYTNNMVPPSKQVMG